MKTTKMRWRFFNLILLLYDISIHFNHKIVLIFLKKLKFLTFGDENV